MKPKEFDDLVRQKFAQNDFGYNPRNWDSLVEQMDGRSKKRSLIMWWLMPLAGVAASVALAVGISPIMHGNNDARMASAVPAKHAIHHTIAAHTMPALAGNSYQNTTDINTTGADEAGKNTAAKNTRSKTQPEETFAINMEAAIGYTPVGKAKTHSKFRNFNTTRAEQPVKKETETRTASADKAGMHTFSPEEEIKPDPKLSIIISGGVSHGNTNSGYAAGATIRKMINDKVYIESEVAFATSTQTTAQYGYSMLVNVPATAARTTSAGSSVAAARTTNTTGNKQPLPAQQWENFQTTPQSYSLYYAQVTPSIGCKIIKRMSVGVGPDFQQMLADNRPTINSNVSENVKVAPTFDIGFVGKTEYNITRTVKAALSYRKGINNVLTPTDKYLDRDYLQFQVQCAIFNK